MIKVVSFSLWGDNPKYCVGAIRNAELVKSIYPGWESWFYCGRSVPHDTLKVLKDLGAKVILRDETGDWTGMFWRFEPIAHTEVEVMLSRDADSRVSLREAVAVDEWLASKKLFHVMRDHPAHSTEILGGMWGARKPILVDMISLVSSYTKGNFWQVDQNFLREVIWPRVSYNTFTHDEFFAKKLFPTSRKDGEFVGQVYDEYENINLQYKESLLQFLINESKQKQ